MGEDGGRVVFYGGGWSTANGAPAGHCSLFIVHCPVGLWLTFNFIFTFVYILNEG
jgi:hypothetical protein